MPTKLNFKIVSEGKVCINCLHAKKLPYREELLCERKGVVPTNFNCRFYEVDLSTVSSPRRHLSNFDKLSPEDFSIK